MEKKILQDYNSKQICQEMVKRHKKYRSSAIFCIFFLFDFFLLLFLFLFTQD